MESLISDELLENTFLYCYKRVSNKDAAQDLTQEIIIEALRNIREKRRIENFYAWYWQMAHNKIALYFRKLQNQAVPIDYVETILFSQEKTLEELISREEIDKLNKAISRLASVHRDIIIRYYLQNQSVAQIAASLNISVGTVTSRLFDARKNLEQRIVEPMENKTKKIVPLVFDEKQYAFLRWSGLDTLLGQQIVISCRTEKKSVNQIADEIDASPVFIEDRINALVQTKTLEETSKGKYLSKIFVFPSSALKKLYISQKQLMNEMHFEQRFFDLLFLMKDDVLKMDFYGKHFDYTFLLWYLSVRGGKEFAEICLKAFIAQNKLDVKSEELQRPIISQFDDGIDDSGNENFLDKISWGYCFPDCWSARVGYIQYQVAIEREPFPKEIPGYQNTYEPGRMWFVNPNNCELIIDLMENPKMELNDFQKELAAECVKNGVLSKTDDGLVLNIPVSNFTFQDNFCALFDKVFEGLAQEYALKMGKIITENLCPFISKDMQVQFMAKSIGWFFQPLAAVYEYGLKNKIYQIPNDFSRSTAGLWIYRKQD